MVAEVEIRTMEIPCPPEQVLPEKVMFVPLLMAKQSSAHRKCCMLRQLLHIKCIETVSVPWFFTVHPVITTLFAETSNPSVLCPAGSPSEALLGASPAAK
jgi:hypothetical protein